MLGVEALDHHSNTRKKCFLAKNRISHPWNQNKFLIDLCEQNSLKITNGFFQHKETAKKTTYSKFTGTVS
jgi:hypothetical protein